MNDAGPGRGPAGRSLAEPGRVDFYVLSAADAADRLRFACRLTEKAYLLQHRVHLHTDSPAAAERLDELLWTFRQGSFVPHELAVNNPATTSPVTIGCGNDAPPAADLLINLASEVPDFASSYARIAEVVDDTQDERARGRARFRHYRQLGYQPATHDIGSTP